MSREGDQPYAVASKRQQETLDESDNSVTSKRIRIDTDPESAETACVIQIASGSSPPEHAEPEHLKRDESSPTKVYLKEDNLIKTAKKRPREVATQSHDIPKKVDQTDEAPAKDEVPKILTSDATEKEVPTIQTHDASEKEVPEIASEIEVLESSLCSFSVKRAFCSTPIIDDESETEEVPGSSTLDTSEISEYSTTSTTDAAEKEVSTSADMEVSEAKSSDMEVSLTQSSGVQSMEVSVTSFSEAMGMDISLTLGDAPEKEKIEISNPVKNILDETLHTSKVEMSQLISPATEKKINDEIERQLKKKIRELGDNYDVIFALLEDVRGPLEVKKTFVDLAIREASRFERKKLIERLQLFLKKMLDFHQKK